ncbi:hypothetical protein AB1K91_09585 [Terribacillus sp. 179-K 1B1 HS]
MLSAFIPVVALASVSIWNEMNKEFVKETGHKEKKGLGVKVLTLMS